MGAWSLDLDDTDRSTDSMVCKNVLMNVRVINQMR